jgi:hypothetical protein
MMGSSLGNMVTSMAELGWKSTLIYPKPIPCLNLITRRALRCSNHQGFGGKSHLLHLSTTWTMENLPEPIVSLLWSSRMARAPRYSFVI